MSVCMSVCSFLHVTIYCRLEVLRRQEVFRPAMTIVEDALLEDHRPNNTARMKKSLLKRSANRARAALRPEEPKSLDL